VNFQADGDLPLTEAGRRQGIPASLAEGLLEQESVQATPPTCRHRAEGDPTGSRNVSTDRLEKRSNK